MIHFNAKYTEDILSGRKTSTIRLEKKAKKGDIFTIGNKEFRISYVTRMKFKNACKIYYSSENCESPEECMKEVLNYYPNLTPDDYVWCHEFKFYHELYKLTIVGEKEYLLKGYLVSVSIIDDGYCKSVSWGKNWMNVSDSQETERFKNVQKIILENVV